MLQQRVRKLGKRLVRQLRPHRRLIEENERLAARNRRLRARVDGLTQERDASLLAGTDPSVTDKLEFLFIVTYGRSGSTLLMGLLDTLPGYCIRGENLSVVYDLFNFHSKALRARREHRFTETYLPQHPWYGIEGYPDQLAIAHMRRLVVDALLRPGPDVRVTGFKEVRWYMARPMEYLDFIETLFPGARFILNTRNLDDVAKSGWHRDKPESRASLEKLEERLREAIAPRGDRAYHIHYDDYVRDPSVLRGLYEWLGEEHDPDMVAKVLATPHSYKTRERPKPAGVDPKS